MKIWRLFSLCNNFAEILLADFFDCTLFYLPLIYILYLVADMEKTEKKTNEDNEVVIIGVKRPPPV
jgi:hypothetical protein